MKVKCMYEKGARMCGNERAWLWCESKRELVTPHVRSKTMFYPCTRSSLHNRTATVAIYSRLLNNHEAGYLPVGPIF